MLNKRSRVSRAVAAAGDYAAADIVSDSASNGVGTTWDFAQIGMGDGKVGTIYKADVTCSEDSVVWRLRLHLFSAAVSTATELDDNAAKTLDNDDRANYLGFIDFPAMADLGEFSAAQADQLQFGYWCGNGGHTLYGVLETLDAETNETASMTVSITLWAREA
jgi:hypothetical protein